MELFRAFRGREPQVDALCVSQRHRRGGPAATVAFGDELPPMRELQAVLLRHSGIET